jgi:hypothetical protein
VVTTLKYNQTLNIIFSVAVSCECNTWHGLSIVFTKTGWGTPWTRPK